MKRRLFALFIGLSSLTGTTLSADDCCWSYQDDACCSQDQFTGAYIGGNLGVGSVVFHRNDLDGFLTDNSGWSTIDTGLVGGVQGGYDWQCGNRLLGLAVDWSGSSIDRTLRDNPNVDDTNHIKSDFDWFTTLRARAGLAINDGLFYLTGGAAVAKFKTTWRDDPDLFRKDDTRWGWTAGVGTEFIVGCNWSAGAEVLFLHFNERTRTFTSSDTTRYSFGHSDSAWVGRFAVNYRFGNLLGNLFGY